MELQQDRRRNWVTAGLGVALVFATLLAYHGVWSHEFLDWDDGPYVVDNAAIRGLGAEQLTWMFTSFHNGHYHPLTYVSYAVDYQIWGLEAKGFLLTNLLLHLVSGLLLWRLCVRLRPRLGPGVDPLVWTCSSAFAVGVFLIHPLRAEAVAWASERKELLASLFALLSIDAYLSSIWSRRRFAWLGTSGVLFWASILSKASWMGLPLILLGLDVVILDRVRDAKNPRRRLIGLAAEKWMYGIGTLAAVVFAPLAQRAGSAAVSFESYGVGRRLLQACYALVYYPWKTVCPTNLCGLYLLDTNFNVSQSRFIASAVFVVIGAACMIWWGRKFPKTTLMIVTYVVFILPVSGLMQSGPQLAADRYSYLPAMLASFALTVLLAAAWSWLTSRPKLRLASVPLALGAMTILTAATMRQVGTWQDSESLWRQVLRVEPQNYLACHNLGTLLMERGDLDEASQLFERALAQQCDHVDAALNLAEVHLRLNEAAHAEHVYRDALTYRPNSVRLLFNLARLLQLDHRPDEALEFCERAAKIKPSDPRIGPMYVRLLCSNGRSEHAVRSAAQLVDRSPAHAVSHQMLALALIESGSLPEAQASLTRAARLGAKGPQQQLLTARCQRLAGDCTGAYETLSSAVNQRPDLFELHQELARCLLAMNRSAAACDSALHACKLTRFRSSASLKLLQEVAGAAGKDTMAAECDILLRRLDRTQTARTSPETVFR